MILFSQKRGYLNLSLPDIHWDQLNVLRYCRIKVTASSTFKTKKSMDQVENVQEMFNFQLTRGGKIL